MHLKIFCNLFYALLYFLKKLIKFHKRKELLFLIYINCQSKQTYLPIALLSFAASSKPSIIVNVEFSVASFLRFESSQGQESC